MKISNKIWMAVLIVAITGGLFTFAVTNGDEQISEASETTTQQQDAETEQPITFEQEGEVVKYSGVTGQTALDTLKLLTDVKVEESSFGEFVTGIGEVSADSSKNFWSFLVNGSMAEVGAGDYVAKGGDQIEWQLTELN